MLTIAIIQARMSSTRLPGKVLRKLGDFTVLKHVIARAKRIRGVDQVWVATSTNEEDDPVVTEAEQAGAQVFRGELANVLSRFLKIINDTHADRFIRITADCPLLSVEMAEQMLDRQSRTNCDYVNAVRVGGLSKGLGCEVVQSDALKSLRTVVDLANEHKEHVTTYLLENPNSYRLEHVTPPTEWIRREYRLTLDHAADWELIQKIYTETKSEIDPFPNTTMILKWMDEHPEMALINQ